MANSRLVLWDVDGTLIQSGRAGLRGMNAAFRDLYGAASALDDVPFAGRTDRAIVGDVLRALGRQAGEVEIAQLRDAYLAHLRVEIRRPVPGHPSGVLPGVTDLLGRLSGDPSVALGLLTGNFERGAAIKLGHFSLWDAFGFGAFGDRHVDRRDLVPVAIARARDAGWRGRAPDDVVVIGDTPLDVDCAHAHGARAIAVATGPFSVEILARASPDLVVSTLADTDRLAEFLGELH
jgi:phosphoglycolate phosphatase